MLLFGYAPTWRHLTFGPGGYGFTTLNDTTPAWAAMGAALKWQVKPRLILAVVADEVRNFAQRSAQAAKDTAILIEDSIDKSAEGKSKVDQVATAIRSISAESGKMKTLVDEIHLGSSEQAKGHRSDQLVDPAHGAGHPVRCGQRGGDRRRHRRTQRSGKRHANGRRTPQRAC